jgi:Xaa-Pro aminopeptidase
MQKRSAAFGRPPPPIHGVGIEFEEAPLPPGHAFFHGEKAPEPLQANVVIAVGNCGLYTGPWGIRVEDTVLVGSEGATVLTEFPRELEDWLDGVSTDVGLIADGG